MSAQVWVRTGWVVVAAAVVGLGVHLALVGLDSADKIASVASLFVALAGLAVAVYGGALQRREQNQSPRVHRVAAGGDIRVFNGVYGNLRVQERTAPGPPPAVPPEGVTGEGGHSATVSESAAGGSITAAENIHGDAEFG
jgi:hypothetical protein